MNSELLLWELWKQYYYYCCPEPDINLMKWYIEEPRIEDDDSYYFVARIDYIGFDYDQPYTINLGVDKETNTMILYGSVRYEIDSDTGEMLFWKGNKDRDIPDTKFYTNVPVEDFLSHTFEIMNDTFPFIYPRSEYIRNKWKEKYLEPNRKEVQRMIAAKIYGVDK